MKARGPNTTQLHVTPDGYMLHLPVLGLAWFGRCTLSPRGEEKGISVLRARRQLLGPSHVGAQKPRLGSSSS